MKGLCELAGIPTEKVFPHNLRHLFARTFYSIEKDIAKLADILGHSDINTTRIYIMTTFAEHKRKRNQNRKILYIWQLLLNCEKIKKKQKLIVKITFVMKNVM